MHVHTVPLALSHTHTRTTTTQQNQGAAGGGLSDHIRAAFVVWLTEGRGFGRATAELTCQVMREGLKDE